VIPALLPVYNRVEVAFERGEGPYLWSTDGRRYLDFGAGIAVVSLGHAHPYLVKALTEQAQKLWHTSNIFPIPQQQRMAERIVALTFADTVFFTNSGAEAVECGIKMIRKYHHDTGNPGKYRIICATGAFHGRTLTTSFAGGQDKLVHGFGPPVTGFDHVSFGNLNELRAAITPETAAILVEPVQGEGGIRPATPDYMRGLRATADEFGLLLMLDEVQCGMGRTGKLFAHEWSGIAPDIMAVAKGIGGGFPVGACLATEKAAVGMTAGTHGSTYGGNPLAMAVANAVLDLIEVDGFLERVEKMGRVLRAGLDKVAAAHPSVFEFARGQGLIQGLKCKVPSGEMVVALRKAGLLTVGAGDNVVRFVPPLIIEESHVGEAVAIIDQVARGWVHKPPAEAAQ
jgi:acetylornithine/N-succinyldiaminopimelate aminotransferase